MTANRVDRDGTHSPRVSVRFRPCDAQTSSEALLEPGERLLDAIEAAGLAVPFGCRSGTCGTCRVDIESGAEMLEPPDANECWQLKRLSGQKTRLACIARARS